MLDQSEAGNENWDDSVLTKEEIEARMQRKVEAVIKRERAMAYAYSHQVLSFVLAHSSFDCIMLDVYEVIFWSYALLNASS